MAENESGTDPVDKALRLFVYGPVGLACYLRDSAPTFMEVFVSRGKREVDSAKRTVEERLGLAKPSPTPEPSVQQRVADGLGKVASQATSMVAAVAGPVVNAATSATTPPTAPTSATAPEAPTAAGAARATTPSANGANGTAPDLPISGYDQLSASQVIERLDGLSRGALEKIRAYELAHRARRTILASIDQLTG